VTTASASAAIEPAPPIPWAAWYGLTILTLINVFAQMDRIALAILKLTICIGRVAHIFGRRRPLCAGFRRAAEDIAAHLDEIEHLGSHIVPKTAFDELASVKDRIAEQQCWPSAVSAIRQPSRQDGNGKSAVEADDRVRLDR